MVRVFLTGASMFKVGRHYNMGFIDLVNEVFSSLESSMSFQTDAVVVASAYPEKTSDQVLLASKVIQEMGMGDNVLDLGLRRGTQAGLQPLPLGSRL